MTEAAENNPQNAEGAPAQAENADARNDVPNEGSQEGLEQGPVDPDDQLVVGRRNEDLNPEGQQAANQSDSDENAES